jgi:hypothetical protein
MAYDIRGRLNIIYRSTAVTRKLVRGPYTSREDFPRGSEETSNNLNIIGHDNRT